MLESKGFKVIEEGNKIMLTKSDKSNKKNMNIKAEIGSNIITINGKDKYLPYIIWDIADVANSI